MAIPYSPYTHWPAKDSGFIEKPLRLTFKKKGKFTGKDGKVGKVGRTLEFSTQNATIWSQSGALPWSAASLLIPPPSMSHLLYFFYFCLSPMQPQPVRLHDPTTISLSTTSIWPCNLSEMNLVASFSKLNMFYVLLCHQIIIMHSDLQSLDHVKTLKRKSKLLYQNPQS